MAAAAAALLAVASAQAATYCVGGPCEGGAPQPSLQTALNLAAGSSEADVVRLAAGTYTGVFDYAGGSGLEIAGAGVGQTVLRNTIVQDSFTLRLSPSGTATGSVHDLSILAGPTGGGSSDALVMSKASGTRLALGAPGVSCSCRGLGVAGPASLSDSTITLPSGGYAIQNSGEASIARVAVRAFAGLTQIFGGDPKITISRSIFDVDRGLEVKDGSAALSDSLLRVRGGIGLEAGPFAGGDVASIVARNSTLIGNGEGIGALVFNALGAISSARIELNSSTVTGFETALSRQATGAGPAHLRVDFSNFTPAAVEASGPGSTSVNASLNVDPGFLGPDDARPRPGSPLIDAGDPAMGGAFGAVDLLGLPRVGGGRRDIGAYEFQPAPPGAGQRPDTTPPTVTKVKLLKRKSGRQLSFRVDEAGVAELVLERRLPGRRRGKACVAPAKAKPGAKQCPRFARVLKLKRPAQPGLNRIDVPARAKGRKLTPGAYRVRLQVTDLAGNRAPEVRRGFQLTPPAPRRSNGPSGSFANPS